VSISVADQDRALAFYTQVLGCELRTDVEVWPGARPVEVVPPGSGVGLEDFQACCPWSPASQISPAECQSG
jgi:catechol 2,3-dioxygenase-like lactoylglutathione lyase family enzyme